MDASESEKGGRLRGSSSCSVGLSFDHMMHGYCDAGYVLAMPGWSRIRNDRQTDSCVPPLIRPRSLLLCQSPSPLSPIACLLSRRAHTRYILKLSQVSTPSQPLPQQPEHCLLSLRPSSVAPRYTHLVNLGPHHFPLLRSPLHLLLDVRLLGSRRR
jgi:hypothetical protein